MKNIVKGWLVLFFSVLLLVGCGGGGDGAETHAGVGSGGTGSGKSYAAGVVTRNDDGELVVNGIHFETSTDTPVENANEPGQPLTVRDLKPGMMVEIDGTQVEVRDGRQVATAVRIRVISQIQGFVLPIFQTPATAGQAVRDGVVYVLGLPVHFRPETLFDDTLPDRERSIQPWDILEVHGFLDAASGYIVATRVTRKDPETTDEFFVKGMVMDIFDAVDPGECTPEQQAACEALQGIRIAGIPFVWQDFSLNLSNLKNSIVNIHFKANLFTREIAEHDPEAAPITLAASVKFNKANFFDSAADVYMDGLVTAFKTEMEMGADGQPRPRIVDPRLFTINNVQVDATGMKTCEVCQTMLPGDRVRVRGLLMDDKVLANSVERVDDLDGAKDPVAATP